MNVGGFLSTGIYRYSYKYCLYGVSPVQQDSRFRQACLVCSVCHDSLSPPVIRRYVLPSIFRSSRLFTIRYHNQPPAGARRCCGRPAGGRFRRSKAIMDRIDAP